MDRVFISEHIKLDFKASSYNKPKKLMEVFELNTTPVLIGEGASAFVYRANIPADSGSIIEKAIKIVPAIAVDLTDIDEKPDLEEVYNILSEIIDSNDLNVKSEISNWAAASSCEHILPLDSNYKIIKWKSDGLIGIDYALPMPLAECLTQKIEKYGKTLNGRYKGTGILTETEETIIEIGLDLCKALEELEALPAPICHRDIKPANIYYFDNHYCLGDFGIAIETDKTQRTGTGTEAYRAPEQVTHCEQCRRDHRQDIYSLGLVLYEMADTHYMYEHLNDLRSHKPLSNLTLKYSSGLNQILHKASQYYVEARFQHASEFREALENLLADKDFKLYDDDEMYIRTKQPEDTGNPYAEVEVFFSAKTLWNAGHYWYKKSREDGNRFSNLRIDEKIMSLAGKSEKNGYVFPINVYEQDDNEQTQIKLSNIIEKTESLTDMYLIGEGGTGKTTALYSIMENVYKKKSYPDTSNKIAIPLFIELSKAPVQYVNVYKDFSSTFIRRYIYFFVKTQREETNISETEKLLYDLMISDDISEIEQIDRLLMKEDSKYQYILLLDGLNEVSRKQFAKDEYGNSGSAVEMILYEIQKLQTYKNVTVIITSRADEAIYFNNELIKYCLTGLNEEMIKEYLEAHHISTENIVNNKRLLNTLKIPLFLKLYCRLSATTEISTPGEILYAFFNECNKEYSARLRLSEIADSQKQFCAPHTSNFITEKMQLFIMDFLLPEIGWYMEKNELFAVDIETIKNIIEPVLKGNNDTDVCGKYGRAFFSEYHRGVDGSINTQTYAAQLLKLNSYGSYVEDIVNHCVYSLGILYVNNQNYSFVHQHIRDYFAALKIIKDLKFAVYVQEQEQDKAVSIRCLDELNNTLLSNSVSQFMSELSDTLNMEYRYNFYITTLKVYRNIFNDQAALGVKNIIQIIYCLQGNLTNINLSELDLRNVSLHGIDISNSKFQRSLINKKNFLGKEEVFPSCQDAVFSPDNKHMIILECGRFRIYNVVSLYEEYISPEDERDGYFEEIVEYSPSGNLFYIFKASLSKPFPHIIEVWDANSHKILKKVRIFEIFHLGIDLKYRHFIKISPDDRYLVIASNFDKFVLYPIFSKMKKRKIFLRRHSPLNLVLRLSEDCSCIATDSRKKYIAFENPNFGAKPLNIFIYNAETLKYETDIAISPLEEFEHVRYLLFSPNGKYLVVFSSETIYILMTCNWVIYKVLSNKTNYGEINIYGGGKFLDYNSELCLLLRLDSEYDEYLYVLWEIEKNNLIYMGAENNKKIYDCLNTSVLFYENKKLKVKKISFNNSMEQTVCQEEIHRNRHIIDGFYTLDHKYFIIYSHQYIQIRNSSSYDVLNELSFPEEISSVCCSNSELYIALSNGNIEIVEIETCKTKKIVDTHFSIYEISLSPQKKYVIIDHDMQDNIHAFTIYDVATFTLIYTFRGRNILFCSFDDEVILAFDKMDSRLMERWSIKKIVGDLYSINLLNTVYWKHIEKELKKQDYFGIYDWLVIPQSNKLAIYISQHDVSQLFIWDLKTLTCEKVLKALLPTNFFCTSKGVFASESGIFSLRIRNLKTLKYESGIRINKLYRDTERITVFENELLLLYSDKVVILNLITKEYQSVFFLPGINVQNAEFTQLHSASDIDGDFLKSLKMHDAIID